MMCRPTGTIEREDFVALAKERGWTSEEIVKAQDWMSARKAKRRAEAEAKAALLRRDAEVAELERRISDLKAGRIPS